MNNNDYAKQEQSGGGFWNFEFWRFAYKISVTLPTIIMLFQFKLLKYIFKYAAIKFNLPKQLQFSFFCFYRSCVIK